ncbi:hypothetical protein C8J57DRAFT_1465612 [Mycena rebaudengoi]|nr:hypothetical protein C8J57DRAFT_1465612 [Mycena rebaudengoi]
MWIVSTPIKLRRHWMEAEGRRSREEMGIKKLAEEEKAHGHESEKRRKEKEKTNMRRKKERKMYQQSPSTITNKKKLARTKKKNRKVVGRERVTTHNKLIIMLLSHHALELAVRAHEGRERLLVLRVGVGQKSAGGMTGVRGRLGWTSNAASHVTDSAARRQRHPSSGVAAKPQVAQHAVLGRREAHVGSHRAWIISAVPVRPVCDFAVVGTYVAGQGPVPMGHGATDTDLGDTAHRAPRTTPVYPGSTKRAGPRNACTGVARCVQATSRVWTRRASLWLAESALASANWGSQHDQHAERMRACAALARMRLVFAPGGDAASFGERGVRVVRQVELGGIAGSECATFYAIPNSRHTSGAKRAAAAARCCDSGRTPASEDGCETPRECDTHTRKDGGEDEKQ